MANYSLNLGFVSRSDGKSSVGNSSYISGTNSVDKRTGQAYLNSHKSEVVTSRVLTPEGAPDWAKDRTPLWNKVEQFEDYIAGLRFRGGERSQEAKQKFIKSAQTGQTLMGAIPIEFTLEQSERCVEDFLKSRFVSRGLVVEYAIHDDKGNPHLHALVTRRPLVEGEFSQRKDREIVSRAEHMVTRKTWEVVVNKHLKMADLEVRIDCRSKEDQGALLLATCHEGWYAQHLAGKGEHSRIVADNEAVRQRNIEIITEHPEAIIHEVALKRTTFTQKHIEEEIIRRVGGDEKLFALLKSKVEGLKINSDLILSAANSDTVYDATAMRKLAKNFAEYVVKNTDTALPMGENINREKLYTSADYKAKEERMAGFADTLNSASRSIAPSVVTKAIQAREVELKGDLSEEQRSAIHHLCSGSDMRVLNGKAGTGKTTLLKAVAEAYTESGYTVMGTSFQGKAVEIMQKEIDIPCRTLDSFIYHWKKQDGYQAKIDSGKLWGRPYLYAFQKMKALEEYRFTDKHVLIVDEANMIAGKLWEPFLKEASAKGAKVIVVQDPAQIKSREPGDVGRLLSERYGFAETNTVIRQRIAWQRECSQALNEHQVLDGLKPYYDKGHIQWQNTPHKAVDKLSESFIETYSKESSQMALALTNEEVRELNQAIRSKLKERGFLKDHHSVCGEEYTVGDKIRFTENDNHGRYIHNVPDSFKERFISDKLKGVKNGTFGYIESIQTSKISVELEGGRRVYFDPKEYKAITHDYAITIDKAEGSTFDRSFVMPSRYMDPSRVLVAMSRHRDDVQVYTDRETFVDLKDMVEMLSRGHFQETLQDYSVSPEQQPYLDRARQYRDLLAEAISLREEMEGSLQATTPLYKHKSYESYQDCYEEKKQVAGLILGEWNAHKPFTRLAGIRKDVLEVETGLRTRLLSDLEQRAAVQVESYKDAARTTKSLWQHIKKTHPGVLAVDHKLYGDYETRRSERDSMAAEIVSSPKLYRQFIRQEDTQDKVYWVSAQAHAKSHLKRAHDGIYVKILSPEDRTSYDLLKSYIDTRNKSAALYSEIKKAEESAIKVDNPERLLQFKAAQIKRDDLALEVVKNAEHCEKHFGRFNLKEDALLTQAVNGEIRHYAKRYMTQTGSFLKVEYASILQGALQDKAHYRIAKESGIDFQRLKFDISFGQAIVQGKVSGTQDPDKLYGPLQKYLESNREAGRLWKLVKSGQEDLKPQANIAFNARNDNANNLSKSDAAMGVISVLRPGIEKKVLKQAGVEHPLPQKPHTKAYQKNYITADQILQEASRDYKTLVTNLLGPENPKTSNATALRFGKKGSLVFNIEGPKAGAWYDFASVEGGNVINLVIREKGCDFKQALEHLGGLLGVTPETKLETIKRPDPQKVEQDSMAEKIQKVASVQYLHAKSVDIKGTVADTYLRKTRSIKCDLSEDIRALPKGITFEYKGKSITLYNHTLATFGRDKDGILLSVQLTSLTGQAERATKVDGTKVQKRKYGIGKESFVTLQSNPKSNTVIIAEGVETALSLKQAGIDATIVAAQGIHNIKNYEGPEKHIVLAADNDDNNLKSGTHKVIADAHKHFEDQDNKVTIIKPDTPGQDFNDILIEKGAAAIENHLRPIKANQASEKISTLMNDIKNAKSPDQKECLEYDLKTEIKMLKYYPQVLEGVKNSNPEIEMKISETLEKGNERGR